MAESDSFDDDTDLPLPPTPSPAPPPQSRDPATGQFTPSAGHSSVAGLPPPEAPAHSAYHLAKAQQYDIDPASLTPGELDRMLLLADRLDRQRQTPAAPKAEPAEEPFDWGQDTDGKALTEETAKAYYTPPIYRAIKASQSVSKIEKESAALKESVEQERQARNHRAVTKQLHTILAERPDLFGEKPGQAKAGTAEAERYQIVTDRLTRLLATQKHTTLDADTRAAMELFGAPPSTAVAAGRPRAPQATRQAPSIADYRTAELAPPTNRRGTETLSYRDRKIQELVEARKENGTYTHSTPDDDDDLPG